MFIATSIYIASLSGAASLLVLGVFGGGALLHHKRSSHAYAAMQKT
jgi:hypothetical protein